ncbi:MAG: hypothetical protein IJV19_01525 [Prevotella sp.]|nr:hypothetical protein [Prevotella sp.]
MTVQEELELLLQIMHKHDLPMSPILEYAINEKLQAGSSCSSEMSVAEETADEDIKDVCYYKERFAQLSTGVHNGKKLPHKAVLLLSIMALFEGGTIKDNKIELTNVIAHTFTSIWESYHLGDKVPSVWIPFWYMKSEPFWHFKACTDENVLQNLLSFAGHPSVGQMRSVIAYAYLDEPLFELMKNKIQRTSLDQMLIDTYLKNS